MLEGSPIVNIFFTVIKLFSFVLTILFILTLASDMAVLYGDDGFSILVLSTKKP